MITRIEIDGFKSFQGFGVDLAPFQVIIGPNGCGKSNLFDAIQLLANLADTNLNTAFQSVRGEAVELFTVLTDSRSAEQMSFAVEMLVDPVVRDEWGDEARIKHRRLRYSVTIARRSNEDNLERLHIVEESLTAIAPSNDLWRDAYPEYCNGVDAEAGASKYSSNYFSTTPTENGGAVSIIAPIEHRHSGIALSELSEQEILATYGKFMHEATRTLLSRMDTVNTPPSFAARQELRNWKVLRLNADTLRTPSNILDDPHISASGAHLAATLVRLQKENKHYLTDISRDMINLVHNVSKIGIDRDMARSQYAVYATMKDDRRISARLLSDGTLCMLALATLHNDPQHRGLLCFEEPEDGVHPGALKRLVRLLRDMTTDLSDLEQADLPLRQLLVTTHSPEIVGQLRIEEGELLYADMATRVIPQGSSLQVTLMFPVRAKAGESPERAYALHRVIEYLTNPDVTATRSSLLGAFGR